MLYQSNWYEESNIPRDMVVIMCERCWGIITMVEKYGEPSLKYGKEKETICLYCKKNMEKE
jgi:hypothetical protein